MGAWNPYEACSVPIDVAPTNSGIASLRSQAFFPRIRHIGSSIRGKMVMTESLIAKPNPRNTLLTTSQYQRRVQRCCRRKKIDATTVNVTARSSETRLEKERNSGEKQNNGVSRGDRRVSARLPDPVHHERRVLGDDPTELTLTTGKQASVVMVAHGAIESLVQ